MSVPAGRAPINSSAANVFDVLRLVSASDEPLGVAEIGRRLELPGSTVYRALITLEESEYISRYQNASSYVLGPMPRLLSRALFRRFALHRASLPILRRLARETGETSTLSVRLGWYSLKLAVVYGGRDFYHRDRLGEVTLLHANLSSRAILAFLHDGEIEDYWRFVARRHPQAEVDRTRVGQAIIDARSRNQLTEGLAMSPGHSALALPVRDPQAQIIGSMSLNGPVLRGEQAAPTAWREERDQLEALVATDTARFRSPFGHIPPNDMFIQLPTAILAGA